MRTKGLAPDASAWVEGGTDRAPGLAARRAAASGPTRWPQVRSLALTGLVMLAAGCSAGATLESVLKPDGAAATVEDIRVSRDGTPVTPALSMRLEPGDDVQTEADSTAIIRFADGTEVFVGSNTHVRIGSLWVLFGQVYVKARGLFRVETVYVTAGVEGTEYLLTVGIESEMSMVVLDGAVRLTSKTASWQPIALRKLDQGVFLPQETPRMSRVDPAEGNRIIQAINQRVPQILVPSSLAATPGLTPAGTGVATTPPLPLSPATGTGVVITPRPPGTGSGVVSQPGSRDTGVGARPARPAETGVPKAASQPQPQSVPKLKSQSLPPMGVPKLPTAAPGKILVPPKIPSTLPGGAYIQPKVKTTLPGPIQAVPKSQAVPTGTIQMAPGTGVSPRLLQQAPPSPR